MILNVFPHDLLQKDHFTIPSDGAPESRDTHGGSPLESPGKGLIDWKNEAFHPEKHWGGSRCQSMNMPAGDAGSIFPCSNPSIQAPEKQIVRSA